MDSICRWKQLYRRRKQKGWVCSCDSQRTSRDQAELTALTRALELLHEKRVNEYTNLRYTFLILHVHVSIWKERELLTSNKEEIKHPAEIFKVLEAVQVPLQVAIMPCPGHQKEDTEVARRINLANQQRTRLLKENL